jgi:polygalacturonase
MQRRDMLKFAGTGVVGVGAAAAAGRTASAGAESSQAATGRWTDVRSQGAKGDGATVDTPAINRAIESLARDGGGTLYFPAGTYLSYSIHLKSKVGLFLDHGAVILAGPTPIEGATSGGYDVAEPQGAWEPYQDYGHNHWHNSLLWGEELDGISITGPGLIWGKGLSRGWDKEKTRPDSNKPCVGNKTIALKNCRNVLLCDFKILEGGWFGVLATGVDNLTIDNLLIDTIRDGMDIDCCRNVRVSNCTVNSPWDDGICPKSSYALGYTRATENLTITNCFVTGGYQLGSVLDGKWKPLSKEEKEVPTGRIKLGTESNGGFKNVTISNCVFESCQGFALETEDGAIVEDRPAGTRPGVMRRVLLSNITSSGASPLPSIISGVPGQMIEDIKLSDVILQQAGGASAGMASIEPPENEAKYPDPHMFGDLPATGLFARHIRNLELSSRRLADVSLDSVESRKI